MSNRIWTDVENAKLRALWADANFPIAKIGDELGRTAASVEFQGRNVLRLGPKAVRFVAWTDEQVLILRKGVEQGKSYGVIAKMLGTTRNAICGKVLRLGLAAPRRAAATRKLTSRPDIVVRMAAPRQKPSEKTSAGKISPPLPTSTPRLLLDLERCMCRWAVGEDPGPGAMDRQLFCAEVTAGESSYCAHHAQKANQKNRTPDEVAMLAARAAKARAAKRPGALQFGQRRAA